MRFKRLFGSGLDKKSYDPRDKVFAEFVCDLCGKSTDIDVTRTRYTFQFDIERRCPNCGQINSADKLINLQAQIDKLTAEKTKIQVEIDRCEREMNELQVQKDCSNGKGI